MSDVYFLCRLKINHDSHEFILEFGTVANTQGCTKCLKILFLMVSKTWGEQGAVK
jgi:hypothetical protein